MAERTSSAKAGACLAAPAALRRLLARLANGQPALHAPPGSRRGAGAAKGVSRSLREAGWLRVPAAAAAAVQPTRRRSASFSAAGGQRKDSRRTSMVVAASPGGRSPPLAHVRRAHNNAFFLPSPARSGSKSPKPPLHPSPSSPPSPTHNSAHSLGVSPALKRMRDASHPHFQARTAFSSSCLPASGPVSHSALKDPLSSQLVPNAVHAFLGICDFLHPCRMNYNWL